MKRRVSWLPAAMAVMLCSAMLTSTTFGQAPQAGQPQQQARAVHTVPRPASTHASPQAPAWFPLAPEHEEYLNKVLAYWEHKASEVERFRCQFKRWEYDANWVGDPHIPKTYSEGSLKYAAPDKGPFRVEKSSQVVLPLTPGTDAQYTARDGVLNEHWVCDGKSIFEFDGHNKQLVQRELPPEMHGKQIVEGPLPFLFGVDKADRIKQRYWIRPLEPPNKDVYMLEATPKLRQDAADAKKMEIFIAAGDFLPEGIVLYHRNNTKTTFAFADREKNWPDLGKLWIFHREFYEPKAPAGWKKVVEKYQAPASVPAPGFQRQAQQPGGGAPR